MSKELLLPRYDAAGNVLFGQQAQEFTDVGNRVVIQIRNLPVVDDDGYGTGDVVPHMMFFRLCDGKMRNCSISMNDAWQCVPEVAGSSNYLVAHALSVTEELWQNRHSKSEVYKIAHAIEKFMGEWLKHHNENPEDEQKAQIEAMGRAGLKLVVNNEVVINAG